MAWTETEPFGWQGRYYEYRSISIWPRPVQQPHPKIYMSGSSPEAGEFAAKNRIGLGFAVTTVPIAKKAVAHYRAQARESRLDAGTRTTSSIALGFHVAETDDQALEDFTDAVEGRAAPRPDDGQPRARSRPSPTAAITAATRTRSASG